MESEYKYNKTVDAYLELISKSFKMDSAEIAEMALEVNTGIVSLYYNLKGKLITLNINKDGFVCDNEEKIIGVVAKYVYNELYEYLQVDRLF